MSKVHFDPDARAEFLAAVEYYDECEFGLGRRFSQLIETEVHHICEMPFRYRAFHNRFRRCLVQKFPYAIIFFD